MNSIWEGSGNIMCLDVLRAIERTPNASEVLRQELAAVKNDGSGFCRAIGTVWYECSYDESQARILTRELVLAFKRRCSSNTRRRR